MAEDFSSFEKRVQRVDPDHRPTMWRKWRTRSRKRKSVPLFRTAVALLMCYCTLTATKVIMERELGSGGFDAKVARLSDGGDAQKVAAALLWRDPVMAYVQGRL